MCTTVKVFAHSCNICVYVQLLCLCNQSHLLADLNAAPLCFILYADKTKLSTHSTVKGYPIMVCCVNLPIHIQNGKGIGSGWVVGWLLIMSLHCSIIISNDNSVDIADQRRSIWTWKTGIHQLKVCCMAWILHQNFSQPWVIFKDQLFVYVLWQNNALAISSHTNTFSRLWRTVSAPMYLFSWFSITFTDAWCLLFIVCNASAHTPCALYHSMSFLTSPKHSQLGLQKMHRMCLLYIDVAKLKARNFWNH